MSKYVATIGLEVHVQLKTRTKMFCGCRCGTWRRAEYAHLPVCFGFPGALPVMNQEALRLTALAGLMLDCEIPAVCKFDRKNYFYPDMPKNYQISQYDLPFCLGGVVPLHDLAYPKDAQKTSRPRTRRSASCAFISRKMSPRASTWRTRPASISIAPAHRCWKLSASPTSPVPEEAFAYLSVLQQFVVYGGISDADMEKGQLRCDCQRLGAALGN